MQETINLDESEATRLANLSLYESRLQAQGYRAIAGVDEAGRGPLAGPVVAAACILPVGFLLPHLNDSKQLSKDMREKLFASLINQQGVILGIGIVSASRIDEINILQATFEAMLIAIRGLSRTPDYLLIDGNQLPLCDYPKEGIVQGDALSISVAAASIVAKVTRDRIMEQESIRWPSYGFAQHKGYATAQHLKAIESFGPCPLHRKSFEPIKRLSTKWNVVLASSD